MRRLVARKVSYRVVAVVCFALGAGWHLWFAQKEPESRIIVQALSPQTLIKERHFPPGYEFGGHITTCSWQFTDTDQQEKECILEKEQAREFLVKNWQEKRKSYMEIEYPCADCSPIFDVMIEQNDKDKWQIMVFREPDLHSPAEESVAVALKRRRATKRDEYSHKPGELLLVLLDAKGEEILAL